MRRTASSWSTVTRNTRWTGTVLADFKALGKPLIAGRIGNLGLGVVSIASTPSRRGSHYLHHRAREMDEINALPEAARLPAFLKKTERALQLSGEIRRKLAVEMPPSRHFKTWLEVFPEVAKRL